MRIGMENNYKSWDYVINHNLISCINCVNFKKKKIIIENGNNTSVVCVKRGFKRTLAGAKQLDYINRANNCLLFEPMFDWALDEKSH